MRHSSGLIIFKESETGIEYLLLQNRKSKSAIWSPPKGHNNPGESDLQTAVRETEEETGLVQNDYKLFDGFNVESKYLTHKGEKNVVYFVAELTNTTAKIRLSKEHKSYSWMHLDKALEQFDQPHVSTKFALRQADEFLINSGRVVKKTP